MRASEKEEIIGDEEEERILERVYELFEEQKLASLATEYEGQSYSSLVAFASTEDLETLIFATNRSTRKYSNITSNPLVSLLVDNRCNAEEDFKNAVAVTATGYAEEVFGEEWENLKETYMEKHPQLKDFVEKRSTALLKVYVENYVLVEGFSQVSSIEF